MSQSMISKNLLPGISPAFSEQLMRQTNERRCIIVRTNYNTKFAQAAPELDKFRSAMTDLIQEMDDDSLSEIFQRTVPLTSYAVYDPILATLSKKPYNANAIVDLLSPGLPDYIAYSSSTSGGNWKGIPIYSHSQKFNSSDGVPWTISDPLRRRTTATIFGLFCEPVDVEDEENRRVKTIYLSSVTAAYLRMYFHLDPATDVLYDVIKHPLCHVDLLFFPVLDHAAPYATAFITKWRTYLLIHALFALSSRSLESMSTAFITTFVDMMGYLDAEFDMIVKCIKDGTIPDLEGLDKVRHYLEPNHFPDPERAAELQSLGRPSSRPGWCSQAWPSLRSIFAVASGSFSSSLPLALNYLGSDVNIHPLGYGSTECAHLGQPYDPLELNLWKPSSANIIEFLDISKKDDSVSAIVQLWEVEIGGQYEIIVTTPDGLWRYRLEDVVEISGFDPTDGVPIFRFVGRRNATLRLPRCELSEPQLRTAMSSVAQNLSLNLVDWTATTDNRCVPSTVGFFVELASDQAVDVASGAPDHILDALKRSDQSVVYNVELGWISKPTIRLVRSGTFSEFKQMKLDEGSKNVGQLKVPVIIPKDEYVTWFSDRVVHEL